MKKRIEIDPGAGPCFGVQRAIQMADELLNEQDTLACLGDLIHNDEEINRLINRGLKIVSHCQLVEQSGRKMLIRAHGEPPSTFRIASNFDVEIMDATCPIVKKLQNTMRNSCLKMKEQNGQVILFGDIYHAEVIGLKGHCSGEFHIVRSPADLELLCTKKPTVILSQTTKYQSDYYKVIAAFKKKREKEKATDFSLEIVDSFCKQVAQRDIQLIDFLRDKDMLVFVSGKKSSNGNYLFHVGKKHVKSARFISSPDELDKKWFKQSQSIGISGATSTPLWLLEKTQKKLEELLN